MRPFSSSVLLYSPENTIFSTFSYLLPLPPTTLHCTSKMINVNEGFKTKVLLLGIGSFHSAIIFYPTRSQQDQAIH